MADLPYRIVIGLEVHVQLLTRTKLFCGCSTQFGLPPNSATCPICIGMPGVLPVMNRQAFELALKFKELAYVFAEPYSAADFMHGPMALAQRGLPAVIIGVRGPSEEGMLELADQLVDAGVGLFPISDDPDLLAKATSTHSLSLVAALAGVPESLSPIVSVIPGQLLAMYLAARRRGGNLDLPRRLAKVTRTE